jgi:hypothetical protein
VTGVYMRSSVVLTVPAGSEGSTFADCRARDFASGGGFSIGGGDGHLDILEARPVAPLDDEGTPTSYFVRAFNDSDASQDLQVYVVCLDLSS